MPAHVTQESVIRCMTPRLGTMVAAQIAPELTELLAGYSSFREEFSDLENQLQQVLFSALYRICGPRLQIQTENREQQYVRLEDLPALADDAMFALLDTWPVNGTNYTLLWQAGIISGNTSALRILYCKYPDRLQATDLPLIEGTLRENLLPIQRKGWLD